MLSADNPPPRRSALRDTIPEQPAELPPPEVLAALAPLPPVGPWEGGTTDLQGRRWVHQPWQGWQLDPRPAPRAADRGRVYRSKTARRARRARRVALLVRWAALPALLVAGALVVAGVVNLWWVLGSVAVAAVTAGWTLGR